MLQRAVAANVRSLRGICERILRTKRHRHTRLPSPYCSGHTSLSPRDICLSTFIKKRNTLYLRIKNYKSGHSPPGEKTVNLVDLAGFEPATSSVRFTLGHMHNGHSQHIGHSGCLNPYIWGVIVVTGYACHGVHSPLYTIVHDMMKVM